MTFTRVAWLLTLGFDMLTMFAVNSCLWKRSSFEIAEPQARRNSVRTGRLNKVFLGLSRESCFPRGPNTEKLCSVSFPIRPKPLQYRMWFKSTQLLLTHHFSSAQPTLLSTL